MDYLIKLGMTIEETVNHSVFGPPLDTKEAAQQAISAAKENLKLVEVKGKRFQVEKSTSDYRLCFSPLESDPDRSSIDLESGVRCGEKDKVPGAARRHSRAASAEMQKAIYQPTNRENCREPSCRPDWPTHYGRSSSGRCTNCDMTPRRSRAPMADVCRDLSIVIAAPATQNRRSP